LRGAGVVALVGKREPVRVPEHVGVDLEGKPRLGAFSLEHAGKVSGDRQCRSLGETEGAFRNTDKSETTTHTCHVIDNHPAVPPAIQ
jgi:hypothetical protein